MMLNDGEKSVSAEKGKNTVRSREVGWEIDQFWGIDLGKIERGKVCRRRENHWSSGCRRNKDD